MKNIVLAAVTAFTLSTGSGLGFQSGSGLAASHDFGQSLRGGVVTTGRVGQMQTTTLPGGGQGVLVNNGNGIGTVMSPTGGVSSVQIPQ